MASIKIRAKAAGDVVTIKALMKHPMEGGQRKDKKTGELIPAHFIQDLNIEVDGKVVAAGSLSAGISKNPYIQVQAPGKAGSAIKVSWTDNKGGSDSAEGKAK